MEALTKFLAVALPLLMLALLGMGMLLIYLAGKTMLEAKRIDLVSVAIVILILLLIPVGIREYPPMLTDAFIDAWVAIWGKSDEIEAITTEIINDSSSKWSGGDNAPVIIPTPENGFPTAIPVTPTPNMFEATATAFFTAVPPQATETPRPMIEPARTQMPTATTCVGYPPCLPPTPVPGN